MPPMGRSSVRSISAGAPEQAATDENGHIYIDIEDKSNVAVVDAKTLKVTAHYDLKGKGGTPAGLALDAKNQRPVRLLPQSPGCRDPQCRRWQGAGHAAHW